MKSIMGNKGRSALTMLGIIIGVGSVIVLTGIGGGTTADITEELSSMGVNKVTVSMMRSWGSTRTIELEDMQEYQEENSDKISMMSPYISVSGVTVKSGNKNTDSTTSLDACDSNYDEISDLTIESGRFFSDYEIENRSKVCVVGTYIVQELFSGVDPVGEYVKINGNKYEIIGVYEESDDSTESSSDDKVTIPYTTATRTFKMTISSYYFYVDDSDNVTAVADDLEAYIMDILGSDEGFSVSDPTELLDSLNEMTGTLTTMLAGIAGISLVVGGIGIMNIMTVSVSERTREIGIRKAIGARTTDILLQFLIEAVVLSGMGGLLGIVLGLAIGAVCNATGIVTYVTQMNMVSLSFLFSLAVGVFFGLAPAQKAAKLNPIDALHSD